ncbi:FAD/NAD(P)-binding oxidoreductase, partial [Clostridium perfringens]
SMVIDDSEIDKGYIRVTGTHYGKITIAPAIAKMLCDTIANNLNCTLKKNFIDKRREIYKFRELGKKEANEIIAVDKRYGKIICVCNNISEGEIVDCIRRPLGARTVEGVKRRTGSGFGSCHGSYCYEKIVNILARELDKKVTDIVEDSKNSKIISSRIKEFK